MNFERNVFKISQAKKMFTTIVILMPIIGQYLISSITLFTVFIVGTLMLLLVKKNQIYSNEEIPRSLIIYVIYVIVVTCFSALTLELTIGRVAVKCIRFLMIIICFYFIARKEFDFEYGYSIYTKVVYVITAATFFQLLFYLITKVAIPFYIPGLKLDYMSGTSVSELVSSIKSTALSGNYRPSSFFIEPAHQAEYCVTWVAIALFKSFQGAGSKDVIKAIVVSAAILLTQSSTGIVICVVIWAFYLIYVLRSGSRRAKNTIGLLLPVIICVGICFFANDNIRSMIQWKIYSLQNLDRATSLSLRLFRGWYLYQDMDIFSQIFGCGYNNFAYYYVKHGLTSIYDQGIRADNVSYMNGISSMLCNLGVVGTILYFWFLGTTVIKKHSKMVSVIFGVLCLLLIASQLYDTATFFMIIEFIISYPQNTESRERVLN